MGGNGRQIERSIIYKPLPSQRRFHDLACRFKGFSGPIGSGKSQALCQEAIRLSYLNPGRVGLLGAPTYPMLRDVTQATLFEILDANRIPYEQNKAENTIRMLDSRSRILFRPVEEFERLRGTNLAWFGVDELTYTQEEAWQRLEGRLRDPKATRLCGFGVWTPNGYDWVYRRFIRDRDAGYEVVLAKPKENRYLLAKTPDFYLRLQDSYDESFYRQEVLGEYLAMDGSRVYSRVRPHGACREPWRSSRTCRCCGRSTSMSIPMSSVIVQKVGSRYHVLDEIVLQVRHHAGGVRGVSEAVSEAPGRNHYLRGRRRQACADQRGFGLRDYRADVPGAYRLCGRNTGCRAANPMVRGAGQPGQRAAAVGVGRRFVS